MVEEEEEEEMELKVEEAEEEMEVEWWKRRWRMYNRCERKIMVMEVIVVMMVLMG